MTSTFLDQVRHDIGEILIGKAHAIELAVVAMVAGGHLLIEDRPGVGKTLLARALARSFDLPFQRIQCTADMLPADILGSQVYQPKTGDIVFRPGPVFTSVLVADELNRTPPRTQSALLECMQEGCVSIDRQTHELPDPFFVVATQNPLNFAGTYPLPESQLDRFIMRIQIGYPEPDDEIEILCRTEGHERLRDLSAVGSRDDIVRVRREVAAVKVDRELAAYIVELAGRTRSHGDITLGVSSRGTQALHRAARARALLRGRDYVIPEDIRVLARPVFCHRMRARGGDAMIQAVFGDIMENMVLPS